VRARQPRLLAHLLDAEALWPVGAHQLGESSDWHSACSRHKLQQACPFLVIRLANKLQKQLPGLVAIWHLVCKVTHLPEPDDLLGVAVVVPVNSVALPVLHVHVLHAAQDQL